MHERMFVPSSKIHTNNVFAPFYKSMDPSSKILYGGFEGTTADVCENTKSLGEFILKKFEEIGNKILLIDGISKVELSGKETKDQVIQLARCLQLKFGLKTGQVISVCSENRIEFALTLYAAIFLGVTVAPMNITYTERELNHAVNLSRPKIAFVSHLNCRKFLNVKKKNSFIQHLIVFPENGMGRSTSVTENVELFEQLMSTKIENLNKFICEPQNMRDRVVLILCSSGTTGLPKGVQLTQYNICIGNIQVHTRKSMSEGAAKNQRTVLAILPFFHAFGVNVLLTSTLQCSKIVIIPRFAEIEFLQSIETYKVNTVYAVPPIIIFLAKSPIVDRYNLNSLECLWSGAAPMSKELETSVINRLKLKAFRQGYGMTEGTFAMLTQDDDFNVSGSVGRLLKGIFGRVVDENGNILGPNDQGEVQFKSDCLMKGYIGNPQATSATIDSGGWLHTGDIGYYNENGEWFIVDRLKELIKYKGYQVPPAELEALLLTNEHIRDVGVIGLPDPVCGELPFAFAVRQPKSTVTENDVIQFVADRVSPPKRLHGGIKFIDVIPKNASGKILRRVLREMVQSNKSNL